MVIQMIQVEFHGSSPSKNVSIYLEEMNASQIQKGQEEEIGVSSRSLPHKHTCRLPQTWVSTLEGRIHNFTGFGDCDLPPKKAVIPVGSQTAGGRVWEDRTRSVSFPGRVP